MSLWKKSTLIFLATALVISIIPGVVFATPTNRSELVPDYNQEVLAVDYSSYTKDIANTLKNFNIPEKPKPVVVVEPIATVNTSTSLENLRVRVYGDWESEIRKVCAEYNCTDYEVNKVFIPMMYAESGGDNTRSNSVYGASGLFQHLPQYWSSRVKKVYGNSVVPNIWDGYQQIRVTIYMYKVEYQAKAWLASKCSYLKRTTNCWDPDNLV